MLFRRLLKPGLRFCDVAWDWLDLIVFTTLRPGDTYRLVFAIPTPHIERLTDIPHSFSRRLIARHGHSRENPTTNTIVPAGR